jgi:hypothetical protein
MRTLSWAGIASALWLTPGVSTAADSPARRFDVAASIGYAAPLGDAERGAHVSDTILAVVPVALDMAYRLAPRIGIAAHVQYGVGIPTLCHTAGDSESSLGSDVGGVLAARIYLPQLGPIEFVTDAGIGYEWLTTRLSDAGAHSARAYHGPILFAAYAAAAFRLGEHWSLGPLAGISLGTFTSYALETNLGSFSGNVPARAVHLSLSLGVRLTLSL